MAIIKGDMQSIGMSGWFLTEQLVCDFPATGDVEEGVKFDNGSKTGTFVVPAENIVKDTETYGDNEEFTGTYTTEKHDVKLEDIGVQLR